MAKCNRLDYRADEPMPRSCLECGLGPCKRMTPKECQHASFAAKVKVGRLSHVEGGPISAFCADVKINCAECGMPFRFIGLPAGVHFAEPRVAVGGMELRAPIEPATHDKFETVATYTMPPRARN